ncbi:hypothetical protein PSTG_19075, partial [Puccinia striiformis f. sp. tritici PST-78]
MARPYWSGPGATGEPVGKFREDIVGEMIIWRPVLAKMVSLEAIKAGQVDLIDLMKINALMDAQDAALAAANNEAFEGIAGRMQAGADAVRAAGAGMTQGLRGAIQGAVGDQGALNAAQDASAQK